MWKRMLLMLFLVTLAIAGIAYAKFRQIQAGIAMGKSFAPPPSAVTTLTVHPQPWTPTLQSVGSIRAIQGVTVSTDLAGIVAEIGFESGQSVRKGDSLIRLQSDQEVAQLHAAEARLRLAQLEVTRKRELQTRNALASSEVDSAESELRQATASVEQSAALLARKHIKAPFDGMVGIRQVSLGQFLNPGSPIVTMHSMDPIRVQFTLPQSHIAFATPQQVIRMFAPGIGKGEWTGTLTALDSQLNEASRALTVEATIPNPDHTLRHGMFVTVEIPLPPEDGAFLIPASSVNYAPYGDSVYVVKDTKGPDGTPLKTVTQQPVKLGEARGDQVRILTGLKDGDEVVTSGVFKLRPDAPVQINNTIQPPNEAKPKPPNT